MVIQKKRYSEEGKNHKDFCSDLGIVFGDLVFLILILRAINNNQLWDIFAFKWIDLAVITTIYMLTGYSVSG